MQRKYLPQSVLLFVAFWLLFGRPANAQTPHDSPVTAFHFSPYALQFSLYSGPKAQLKISNFLGTLISGKYHFNDHWAVRVGIGSDFSKTKYEFNEMSDSLNAVLSSASATQQRYSIQGQMLYYLTPQKTIKTYAGFGPYYFYYQDKQSPDNYLVRIWGGKVILGAEWFLLSQASIFLEYTARFRFDRYEQYVHLDERDSQRRKKLELFDATPIQFGLTIYFASKHINQ